MSESRNIPSRSRHHNEEKAERIAEIKEKHRKITDDMLYSDDQSS